MPAMIFAGLPASGKSTLAAAVARSLPAHILNKDLIRAATFEPTQVAYTSAQDALVQDWMLTAAASLWATQPDLWILFDGRTYSKAAHRLQIEHFCAAHNQRLLQILCHCSEASARERLTQPHPAKNRNWALWQRVRDSFEPLAAPDAVINTDDPIEHGLATVLTLSAAA